MKIGDKVRFLSTTGGGKIAGFQKGNIVLVEDEDGFQIPTLASEVVVIAEGGDDYNMFKTSSFQSKSGEEAKKHESGRSVRSIMNEVDDDEDISPSIVDDDPSLGNITFRAPVEERKGGDRLSAYLAFVPVDASMITNTRFEVYLVNDCNYYFRYTILQAEGQAWSLRNEGEVEPNTKLFIEEIGREDLEEIQHLGIQMIAFKKEKSFVIKPTIDVQLRIDGVKFYKLHTFQPNDFFEQNVLLYTIIENDKAARPLVVDAKTLKQEMYANAKPSQVSAEGELNTERIDNYVRRYEKPGQKKGNPFAKKQDDKDAPLVIDLHADALLETTQGMSSADILQYQLDTFKKTLEANKKERGKKIVFIHGKGEGVLRRALIHELTYRYKNLRYQDASFQEYGYGATQVTM